MRSNSPPNPHPTPTLASPFSFFLRVTSSFNPSFTGYSTIEIFIRTIMPVVIIFFVTLYSCKGRTTPNRYKGNLELDSADSVQLSDITLWLSIRQTVLPKGDTYSSNGVPLRADYVQLTLSKTDTFGTSAVSVLERSPSYRESNKGSKEKQGPTLGVHFIEVSVKREFTVYIFINNFTYFAPTRRWLFCWSTDSNE